MIVRNILQSILRILSQARPEKMFLCIGLFFGIIFIFLTPPFQVPDETNHFFKAWQVSEGVLTSIRHDNRAGGFVPQSLVKFSAPFYYMKGDPRLKADYSLMKSVWDIELEADKTVFVDFPNTAVYSPVSYLPQAASIFFLRKLNFRPFIIFYLTRFFSLLFWMFGTYYMIRILPHSKWLFVTLALLPMSLFINMSVSADMMTNLLSFLFIAEILKFRANPGADTNYFYFKAIILVLLLASAKLIYAPILMFFLLIPWTVFKSRIAFLLRFGFLLLLACLTVIFWSRISAELYIRYEDYNPGFRDFGDIIQGADLHGQLKWVLGDPIGFADVILNSLAFRLDMYGEGFIGTLGCLDTYIPLGVIYAMYIVLFIVSISDHEVSHLIPLISKLLLLGVFLFIGFLVLLVQHLIWGRVGDTIIANLQARYFIPLGPVLFLLFYNRFLNLKYLLPGLVSLSAVFALSTASNSLYKRFFLVPVFETTQTSCDAEFVKDNFLKANENDLFCFEGGAMRDSAFSRSGKYSLRLERNREYGFTYRLFGVMAGDVIEIEVWRKGLNGIIQIVGGNGRKFKDYSGYVAEEKEGWQKITIRKIIKRDMGKEEVGFYVFNPESEPAFFDDFTVRYKRRLN